MFLSRCRLLIKRLYNSIAMFNQDNIALAQIAQIFGSELLKVQENATTDGGSKPQIVNINPKQFLVPNAQPISARTKEQEQMLMRQLQAEAEAAYPINEPIPTSAPEHLGDVNNTPVLVNIRKAQSTVQPVAAKPAADSIELLILNVERIAVSLEKIVEVFDKKPKLKGSSSKKKKSTQRPFTK